MSVHSVHSAAHRRIFFSIGCVRIIHGFFFRFSLFRERERESMSRGGGEVKGGREF